MKKHILSIFLIMKKITWVFVLLVTLFLFPLSFIWSGTNRGFIFSLLWSIFLTFHKKVNILMMAAGGIPLTACGFLGTWFISHIWKDSCYIIIHTVRSKTVGPMSASLTKLEHLHFYLARLFVPAIWEFNFKQFGVIAMSFEDSQQLIKNNFPEKTRFTSNTHREGSLQTT